jgi:outer membrane receptor protein involved in Fe transport
VSDEPFLRQSKVFSQLRVRGAWGRAGLQPDVFSALRTYTATVGPRGTGILTPQNFGNPNLKPEIGEEFEVGFDAGLLSDRLGIEFTLYNKDVKDAILTVPLRPSGGFPGSTLVNIGKTLNRGVELALNASPIATPGLGLDLRFTLGTNDSKILDLGGVPPSFLGVAFIQQYNVEGFAPASYFYKKVVSSTVVEIPGFPIPVGVDAMCEGGQDLGRGDGSIVPCGAAPRLYSGRITPPWSGSASASVTLGKRLRLFGLIDFLGGHHVLQGDVVGAHAFFLNSRAALEGTDPRLAGILGLLYLEGDANSVGTAGLMKGGFAKLRTISASYDFPDRVARSLGASRGSVTLSADNVAFLWRAEPQLFGLPLVDPEIMPNRGGTSSFGYTQASWPQTARVRATVRMTF